MAAVLMLEVVGFAGRQVLLILLPCLASSGIGALIFTGLGSWSGLYVPSLEIPGLPATTVDFGDLFWVVPVAVLAAIGAQLARRLGLQAAKATTAHTLAATTLAGLLVGACAAAYSLMTGRSVLDVVLLLGPEGTSQIPIVMVAAAVAMVSAVVLDGARGP